MLYGVDEVNTKPSGMSDDDIANVLIASGCMHDKIINMLNKMLIGFFMIFPFQKYFLQPKKITVMHF